MDLTKMTRVAQKRKANAMSEFKTPYQKSYGAYRKDKGGGYDKRVYKFVRTTDTGDLTSTQLGDTSVAYSFQINNLPNSAEFLSLFDQYRIVKVQMRFIPYQTVANPTASKSILVTVADYDDAVVLNSLQEAYQYTSCRITNALGEHVWTIKPRISMAAYGSGIFSSYSNQPAQWIDSGSNTVAHYGIKAYLTADSGSVRNSWKVVYKYWIECRHPR